MSKNSSTFKWVELFGNYCAFSATISKIEQGATMEEVKDFLQRAKKLTKKRMDNAYPRTGDYYRYNSGGEEVEVPKLKSVSEINDHSKSKPGGLI